MPSAAFEKTIPLNLGGLALSCRYLNFLAVSLGIISAVALLNPTG